MAAQRFDLDALTLDAVRSGALRGRNVTVLGFARSGIALARFFVDAGAGVTIYDGRGADAFGEALGALGGRHVRLALGPDVDPASTWADADLSRPRPPSAPLTRRRSRGSGRPSPSCARRAHAGCQRARPRPAALPGADDRGHRHQGQDDHLVAGRGPRSPPIPRIGWSRGQHGRRPRRPALG